jgi:hypothetical protein
MRDEICVVPGNFVSSDGELFGWLFQTLSRYFPTNLHKRKNRKIELSLSPILD